MISRLRSLLSAAIAFALVLGLGVGTANAATVEAVGPKHSLRPGATDNG